MFNIDDKDLKQLEENLNNVHKYALVDTIRSTLNKEAHETMIQYKKNVRKELTIRTPKDNIVLKSIGYDKTNYSEKDIEKLESTVGQRSEFYGKDTEQLRKQEFGETLVAKGKYTPKATKTTRGGSYKKIVPKQNLISRTNAKKIEDIAKNPVKGDVAKQFRQAIAVVHNTHETINFIPDGETSRHKFGIFQFHDTGTKTVKNEKGKKVRKIKGHSGKLLYSFKDKRQELHKRPMLEPATNDTSKKAGEIFKDEAEKRLLKEMSKNLKA